MKVEKQNSKNWTVYHSNSLKPVLIYKTNIYISNTGGQCFTDASFPKYI